MSAAIERSVLRQSRCLGRASCGHDRRSPRLLAVARVTALVVLLLLLLPQTIAAAPAKEVRRVLVFYEVGPHYPAIALIDQGISDALRNSPYQIELYREYLDTALFPEPATQREFREWYRRKYRDRKPDIIIAVGPSALEFMIAAHEAFFRDVPVVFCTSTEAVAGRARLDSHFTGAWDELDPTKTLETSLRLRPGTKHVFLVGGRPPMTGLFKHCTGSACRTMNRNSTSSI